MKTEIINLEKTDGGVYLNRSGKVVKIRPRKGDVTDSLIWPWSSGHSNPADEEFVNYTSYTNFGGASSNYMPGDASPKEAYHNPKDVVKYLAQTTEEAIEKYPELFI